MGRPKSNNVQINISILIEWKILPGSIPFLDLMRRGI